MSLIPHQTKGQRRPTDNGLLERIESERCPSNYAVLALITRAADILEKNDYLNECLEDESYVAFDALDKLRGKLSERLDEDESGIAAMKRREDAIRNRHDYIRKSEAA